MVLMVFVVLAMCINSTGLITHLTHNLKSTFSTYPQPSIKETHFAKSLGYLLQCVSALAYVKNHLFKLCVMNRLVGITITLFTTTAYLSSYHYGSLKIRNIVTCSYSCFLSVTLAIVSYLYDKY